LCKYSTLTMIMSEWKELKSLRFQFGTLKENNILRSQNVTLDNDVFLRSQNAASS